MYSDLRYEISLMIEPLSQLSVSSEIDVLRMADTKIKSRNFDISETESCSTIHNLELDDMFPLWVENIKTCRQTVDHLVAKGFKPVFDISGIDSSFRLDSPDGRHIEITRSMYSYALQISADSSKLRYLRNR